MDGAGSIRKALRILGEQAAQRWGQILQPNTGTWPEMRRTSDEARVGNEQERVSHRPDAFSYGLWA